MTEIPRVNLDEEKVLRRLNSLVEIYGKLTAPYKESYLNQLILRNCVESYFYDLERTKHFHGIKLGDQYKKAAFTMKWIVRTKPIQLYEGDRVTEQLILVNEVYAILAGLGFFEYQEGRHLSADFFSSLLYTLHYRPLDEGVLTTMMYLLDKAVKGETP